MVEVEIRTPTINEETQDITWTGLALIRVADGEVTVWGEDSVIHLDSVMSIKHGKPVHRDENPEEWARSLPYAYRSGDLVAVVLQDDDPPARLTEPPTERTGPTLPDAPRLVREDERRSIAH